MCLAPYASLLTAHVCCFSSNAEHQYVYRTVVRDHTDCDLSMAPIEEVVTNVTVDEKDEQFGYASHDGDLSHPYASDDQFGYMSHNPSDESSKSRDDASLASHKQLT
jgi:hypothetical protein